MEVSLYLKRPGASTETTVFARISYEGYKIKYYLPEKINPKFWNKSTRQAKETQKFREYPEFNTRLNNIEAEIKTIYRKFLNDNQGAIPGTETFKKLLDAEIKKTGAPKEAEKTFFGFFADIIDRTKKGIRLQPATGKPYTGNTIKTYVTTLNHLTEFQKTRKKKINFDNIDLEFYSDYTAYLSRKHKLSTNSIGKDIKVIKTVMNEATERGVNTNFQFKSRKFSVTTEPTTAIYLNDNAVKEIEAIDLSENKRLESVRDLFLIGCYTGLRYSDYSILKPEQIKDGFIEVVQFKTGNPIVIPVHPTVKAIVAKYNGVLPKSISNQKANDYLKELAKNVESLNKDFSKSITKGGFKVIQNKQKWEWLTTHTARRSFCTNEYLAGTPAITIMAISGHKTERAFLRYIKLTPTEHAQLLKMHWEKRNQLRAV